MKKLIVVLAVAAAFVGEVQARKVERVTKPNSSKGYIAVVNLQEKVAESNFVAAVELIAKRNKFTFRFVKDVKDAKDANAVISIVDEAAKPAMTVSPDVLKAEVNVGGLVSDLGSEAAKAKFIASRSRKVFLRAYAYMAGAGGSGFEGNILDVATIRDLDYLEEFIPADAEQAAARHLAKRGIIPAYVVPYAIACEEGWAPEPKTEAQKKIWDEVHALPTNPIKIVPETQRKK